MADKDDDDKVVVWAITTLKLENVWRETEGMSFSLNIQ